MPDLNSDQFGTQGQNTSWGRNYGPTGDSYSDNGYSMNIQTPQSSVPQMRRRNDNNGPAEGVAAKTVYDRLKTTSTAADEGASAGAKGLGSGAIETTGSELGAGAPAALGAGETAGALGSGQLALGSGTAAAESVGAFTAGGAAAAEGAGVLAEALPAIMAL